MSSFRPIAPLIPLRPKLPGHDSNAPNNDASSSSSLDATKRRRGHITVQACAACRQRKGKCDGARPVCGSCMSRKKACVYDADPSQSSREALRARLTTLEETLNTLQKGPVEEAESMLRNMRATQGKSEHTSKPFAQTTWTPHQLVPDIPDESTTQAAIKGFFSCSGKLFHVFSPDQVAVYHRRVFGEVNSDNSGSSDQEAQTNVAICCLSAIATVGCQYVPEEFSTEVEETYYAITKFYFEAVIEYRPLDAIKICTLIAMYNIMNKSTVALGYIEIGLSMSRRYHLDDANYRRTDVSPQIWIDYRRTWRTLMFFSSWISATLGYVSGNDALCRPVALSEMDIEGSLDMIDIVQTQMAKIALLKSQILRVHMAFKELSISATRTILDDLEKWHQQVPLILHLTELYRQGSGVDHIIRRSIYHVHLLYLGAIILLYRRLAAQSIRTHGIRNDRKAPKDSFDDVVFDLYQKGLMSARESARMIGLLHEDDGVFRKCWLVIFQSYSACVVLLHSVAQKQLFSYGPDSWHDDLVLANKTLLALEFCGGSDRLAARFHRKLKALFNELSAADGPKTGECTDIEMREAGHSTSYGEFISQECCFCIPVGAPARPANIALTLLAMLCQPFGDSNGNNDDTMPIIDDHKAQDGLAVTGLGLDADVSGPFAWNVQKIGLRIDKLQSDVDGPAVCENRFLDSWQPSGWSSEPSFMLKN